MNRYLMVMVGTELVDDQVGGHHTAEQNTGNQVGYIVDVRQKQRVYLLCVDKEEKMREESRNVWTVQLQGVQPKLRSLVGD